MGAQRLEAGRPHDRLAGLVRRVEVDLGGDAPVVVARGVVDDLAHPPPAGLLLDRSICGPRASGPVPRSSCSSK